LYGLAHTILNFLSCFLYYKNKNFNKNMNISFQKLEENDLSLLKQWLSQDHSHPCWPYTLSLDEKSLREHFCVAAFNQANGYIIYIQDRPAGYIQTTPLKDLKIQDSTSCVTLEFFVDQSLAVDVSLYAQAIEKFWRYILKGTKKAYLVYPDASDRKTIDLLERAGFMSLKSPIIEHKKWMIRYDHKIMIYLLSKPGTGKYTISKEIAKHDFVICDNHLINNPIFTLLNYDSFDRIPHFAWMAIDDVRKVVLHFIQQEKYNHYVLTNCLYENPHDRFVYEQVYSTAVKRNSLFVPIMIDVDPKEHLKRITNPARKERLKTVDPKYINPPEPLIIVHHPNLLHLDITHLTPQESAQHILDHVYSLLYKSL